MSSGQQTLLDMALDYMSRQNGSLAVHATRLEGQISLMRKEGQLLKMADWVKMAKILSVEALRRDVGAKRIAESIYPLVDGSRQPVASLAYVSADFATTKLLQLTGVKVEPDIKKLLIQVIHELQTMMLKS